MGSQKGILSNNWKGGIHKNGRYIYVKADKHPRANKRGYVYEHVLIAEKAFGKFLPPAACIHHCDGNSSNLVICQNQSYHLLLHARKRGLEESGNANFRKCCFCHKYENPENMTKSKAGGHHHGECEKKYMRKWYYDWKLILTIKEN